MTWIVMPSQANALGTAFGGQVMAWIDVCAAVAAQRFARADVVTVGMDQLTFLAPIRQGDVVVVRGMVNWAGRTSMEVGVRVDAEDVHTGSQRKTSTAYLTFVAVDGEGATCPVPTLGPVTEDHRRRFAEAQARREARLRFKQDMLRRRAEEAG
ncbi:MAG: acyl-CoA thioesterase [Alphaproteobacteria bacterium]|nr:acyl-CoA thioesterase [Alphaproteobacteria bacterium]